VQETVVVQNVIEARAQRGAALVERESCTPPLHYVDGVSSMIRIRDIQSTNALKVTMPAPVGSKPLPEKKKKKR
jgi:hypothetical protein